MQIFIQTRGKTQDYAFVGAAPPERWWAKSYYRNATSYEKPTLILESLASGEWRCYISAIPSTTRDRVGTMIRYTLVLSGSEAGDKNNLLMLLAYMLDVFATDPASPANQLTALLDAVLAPNIDQWLSQKNMDVQTSIQQISNGIAALKPSTSKSDSLIKKIENWCVTSGSTQAVALLNFVGSTTNQDPAYTELRNEINSAKDSLLLLLRPTRMGANWKAEVIAAGPQQDTVIQNESVSRSEGKAQDALKKKMLWVMGVGAVIAIVACSLTLTTSKDETSLASQALPSMSPELASVASHESHTASPDGALQMQPDIGQSASEQPSAH